jgi:DNA-binding LytR/AlgR family response regulator
LNQDQNTIQKDIFIRSNLSLVKIPLADIQYIEGLADYLKIYIKDRKTVLARMTMKEMAENLPALDFIRVHRSFIIPKNRIQSVKNKNIMIPEREIPIGNTYLDEFFEDFQG